jgi:hypothetical protein
MDAGDSGIDLIDDPGDPEPSAPWDEMTDEELAPYEGPELFCAEETAVVDERPADVVLVLDKSRSMLTHWDHDNDASTPTISRWASLHAVVTDLVAEFGWQLSMGAVLFPAVEVDSGSADVACLVDEEPNAAVRVSSGQDILAAMPPANTQDIWGATPARLAIETAVDHLQSVADGRPQAIVLVTDGAANCSEGATGTGLGSIYDQELETAVADAAAQGIPVYVVGIDIVDELVSNPAVNPFEALSAVAIAGGAPDSGPVPFYDALDETSLADALGEIAESLGCTVSADAEGPEELLRVGVNGTELPRTSSCEDSPDAWRRVEGPGTLVELCPATCESFHQGATLDVRYACYPEE